MTENASAAKRVQTGTPVWGTESPCPASISHGGTFHAIGNDGEVVEVPHQIADSIIAQEQCQDFSDATVFDKNCCVTWNINPTTYRASIEWPTSTSR
jgi:hypothetical protein